MLQASVKFIFLLSAHALCFLSLLLWGSMLNACSGVGGEGLPINFKQLQRVQEKMLCRHWWLVLVTLTCVPVPQARNANPLTIA